MDMRMTTKYFWIAALAIGIMASACHDEEEPEPIDVVEDIEVGDDTQSPPPDITTMYFPPAGSDEWETVNASVVGWDSANFASAIQFAHDHGSYSLMILHKGRIVTENYWKGRSVDSETDLESVSKSLMAFVVGVLQQDGTLKLDDKVSDYLGEGWSQSPSTEGDITIRHLLTMTSGLNEELKWISAPGETWRYCHAAFDKLHKVIEKATDISYGRNFEKLLFEPIGMHQHSWYGTDLHASARDIARYGLLILNKGSWNDQKLIQDDGYFSDMLSTSQPMQKAYGYLWWLNGKEDWYDDELKVTNEGPIASTLPSDAVLAKGKRDQRIYIVPGLDIVVIRQGGDTGLPEIGEGSFDVEFWKRMMSAINPSH